jgi:DNA-directed RNA polymerase subunit N (RpoN/RPB10)
MKINCLSCGHNVDLDDAYDDYEGAVKCFACGVILNIKTEQGHLKSVNLTTAVPPRSLERVH